MSPAAGSHLACALPRFRRGEAAHQGFAGAGGSLMPALRIERRQLLLKETEMPRDTVERAALVVQLDAGAATGAGLGHLGNRGGIIIGQRTVEPKLHPFRPEARDATHIGEGDARIFLQHAVGGDDGVFTALGNAFRDLFGNLGTAQELRGDAGGAFGAIAGTDRRLPAVEVDEIFLDEFVVLEPGATWCFFFLRRRPSTKKNARRWPPGASLIEEAVYQIDPDSSSRNDVFAADKRLL